MSADRTSRDLLAQKALGIFDGVSPTTLSAVRRRAPRAGSVQISPRALADLLDALEDVYGRAFVDRYVALHAEEYGPRRERAKAAEKARSAEFIRRIEEGDDRPVIGATS